MTVMMIGIADRLFGDNMPPLIMHGSNGGGSGYVERISSDYGWGDSCEQLRVVEVSRNLPIPRGFKEAGHGIGHVGRGGVRDDVGLAGQLADQQVPVGANETRIPPDAGVHCGDRLACAVGGNHAAETQRKAL